jgi:hypothetical protein
MEADNTMRRSKKVHPALKHGGYSALGLLPGENPTALRKLHNALIAEFAPNGALEEDIVLTIAHLTWRKQNLGTFRVAELARDRRAAIKRKIKSEVNNSSWEETKRQVTDATNEQARKELGEVFQLVEIGGLATLDRLAQELSIIERLDAMIDRCLKRLLLCQGTKSLAPPLQITPPSRAQTAANLPAPMPEIAAPPSAPEDEFVTPKLL